MAIKNEFMSRVAASAIAAAVLVASTEAALQLTQQQPQNFSNQQPADTGATDKVGPTLVLTPVMNLAGATFSHRSHYSHSSHASHGSHLSHRSLVMR